MKRKKEEKKREKGGVYIRVVNPGKNKPRNNKEEFLMASFFFLLSKQAYLPSDMSCICE